MSLVRNGYVVSMSRKFVGGLFSARLALALFGIGAAIAQEVKRIKLTEKRIQGFMAASKDIAKLNDRADPRQTGSEGGGAGRSYCQEEWLCESRRV
jgi:hypothetical protein